jgi:hypothetical protein
MGALIRALASLLDRAALAAIVVGGELALAQVMRVLVP